MRILLAGTWRASLSTRAAVLGCTVSMVTTRVGTLGLRRRRLKGGEERAGNEAWVISAALCQAVPIDPGPFAEDLLEQLR